MTIYLYNNVTLDNDIKILTKKIKINNIIISCYFVRNQL